MSAAEFKGLSPRVFVSYARSDGEVLSHYLCKKIESTGISAWWDRKDLRRTASWWREIDIALETVEYLVAVLTPTVLDSETCRKEWQWARRKGVCIVGVKAGLALNDARIPRWLKRSHIYEAIDPSNNVGEGIEWQKFINDLNTTPSIEKVPFMVGNLPEDFVPRPEEFERLLAMLLDTEQQEPLAITAALRGAGGYGKTTLAKALCHDLRVQEAYGDGVIWVTLGEKPENITGKVRDCIQALSGERPDFADVHDAASRLAELLDGREVLLVIDDVWRRSHLEPFLQGGERCAHLITTRMTDVLPKTTRKINVDAMKNKEAIALLQSGLPIANQSATEELARNLGQWPLLIKLVNRVIFDRVERGETVDAAITFAVEKLTRHGLTAFDSRDADQRDGAVAKTMSVTLDLLDATNEIPRLFELGIFPEDEDIPLDVIASLWQSTGALDSFMTEELCERFFKLSLILEFDLRRRIVRLHDAIRAYFLGRLRAPRMIHDQLIIFWRDPQNLPNKYAWDWYGWHVWSSSHPERLRNLLMDFNWLQAKLNATDQYSLASEFTYVNDANDTLTKIYGTIVLSSHVLAKDKTQLASQFLGRLPAGLDDETDRLRNVAAQYNESSWIKPKTASLQTPGGALLGVREGNFGVFEAIAVTPKGILAAAPDPNEKLGLFNITSDDTVRIFDIDIEFLRSFRLLYIAISADARLVITGASGTLNVWDIESGDCLHVLDRTPNFPVAVAISGDCRYSISGSFEEKLKVWDIVTGECIRTLDESFVGVASVALSYDGSVAVTGSWDGYIKVWDLRSGNCLCTIEAHSDTVTAISLSPDALQAISASLDKTLKMWDLQTGKCLNILSRRTAAVKAIAVDQNWRYLLSVAADGTLRCWDLQAVERIDSHKYHKNRVAAVALAPINTQGLTGSYDNCLKLWDLLTGECLLTLDVKCRLVNAVALSPDSTVALSGSHDNSLKAWDLKSSNCLRFFEGHSNSVNAVAISADGRRAVSASSDRTLKLWDFSSGRCLRTLKGHSDSVLTVDITSDGRFALSGSSDRTLKVWDLISGRCLRTLKGHSGSVMSVALSSDARFALSGSTDKTLKAWDMMSFVLCATFFGDSPIYSVAFDGPDNILAGDDDGTVHFLQLRLTDRKKDI